MMPNNWEMQTKSTALPRLLIYSVHASCSASIRPRLYRSTRHIGTVSADTSMSCRFSSSAVSKKDSGGAGFHTSHSPTRCPALPPAQLPCWWLQPGAWRLRGIGNKKSLCGVFSLRGKSVRRRACCRGRRGVFCGWSVLTVLHCLCFLTSLLNFNCNFIWGSPWDATSHCRGGPTWHQTCITIRDAFDIDTSIGYWLRDQYWYWVSHLCLRCSDTCDSHHVLESHADEWDLWRTKKKKKKKVILQCVTASIRNRYWYR